MTEKQQPDRLAQIERWIAVGNQLLLDDEDWLIAEIHRLRQKVAQLTEALEIINKAIMQEFDETIGIIRHNEEVS